MLIAIDAPYVPNNMAVVAKGPTVTDLKVSNAGMMFGGKSTDPGVQAYAVEPVGQYTIAVTTTDDTSSPSLEIQFNIPNINLNAPPK